MRIPHEVIVLVRRGDDVLVLRRSPKYEAYWHLVAGALEPGEEPRDAALRELREELALDAADVVAIERSYTYPVAEEPPARQALFAPDVKDVVVDCFAADAPDGWEPTLNDEHDEYRWCSPEEALELLYWPEPRELVSVARRRAAPPEAP